jgi:RND family efflux transporter MFP subunit
MKKIFWTTLLALSLTLAACTGSPTATPPQATAPALTEEPSAPSSGFSSANGVIASAELIPAQHANMTFVISAPVKEILVKEGDVVKAGDALLILNTPDLELSITEAELGVKSAELQYQRANDPYKKVFQDGKITYVTGYVEKRKQTEARLQGAQAALDEAKATLSQGTLIAPFDGTVIDIVIEQGETTQPGKVVLIFADIANMQVQTTDLSERDIPNVAVGQKVSVFIEAINANVTGKVIRISPVSKIVGGDVVYPVIIELDEQPQGLLWGMSAEVQIETE